MQKRDYDLFLNEERFINRYKRWKTLLTVACTFLLLACLSVVGVLAARYATAANTVTLNYTYIANRTLIKGPEFYSKIDANCTEIIFDRYYTLSATELGNGFYTTTDKTPKYNVAGFTETVVDTDGKGCANGGISLYYDSTNKKAYVLAKGTINANADSSQMFYQRKAVTTISFNNFNTSNVTTMKEMFYYCSALATINGVADFNTSNVTTMNSMFCHCYTLGNIDLSSWKDNVAKLEDTYDMFRSVGGWGAGGTITVNGWNLPKLTNASRMFQSGGAKIINVNDWDVSKSAKINMEGMFLYCSKLTAVNARDLVRPSVINIASMFSECSVLNSLNNLNTWDVSNVTSMSGLFSNCRALSSVNISSWNTKSVKYMGEMFYYCTSLTRIYAGSGFVTTSLVNSEGMFAGCTKLYGPYTSFNASYTDFTYARVDGEIYSSGSWLPGYFRRKTVELIDDISSKIGMPGTWYGAVYFDYFDPNNSSHLYALESCSLVSSSNLSLEEGGAYVGWSGNDLYVLSHSRMYAPTSCDSMFADGVYSGIILNNFDTSNVNNMHHMFYGQHSSNTAIYLGRYWGTGSVTNMSEMFMGCDQDATGFYPCYYAKLPQLSTLTFAAQLTTTNVTNMASMFRDYEYSGATLNLSGWSVSKVTDMTYMFNYTNVSAINMKNWVLTGITSYSQAMYALYRNAITVYYNSSMTSTKLNILKNSNVSTSSITWTYSA